MATYHLEIKAHSRSDNANAIALSSYRSGEKLRCDADGQLRNCRREGKSKIEYTCLLNNRDYSRERLWNYAESMERRKDSVVAREMELALPHELPEEERIKLAVTMGEKIAQRYNCAVDVAVHAPDHKGDHRNHHAHILFTPRSWMDNNTSNRSFASKKYRHLNKATALKEVVFWREEWEKTLNKAYEEKGREERVDCRSCEAQGKLKQYERFSYDKYQVLRNYKELENAKKASRLALEIERDQLEIHDLLDMREEILKKREKLLKKIEKKENQHAGFREETGRSGRGEPLTPKTESGDFKETGKLPADSDKPDSGSIPERSHEQSGTGPENSQREQSLLTGTGGTYGRSSGELETGPEATAHEGTGGLGRRTWDGIKETAKKLWEYLFKSEFLDIINPFKKKKAPTPKPEPVAEKAETQAIKQLPENYQNHIPVFNDLKRSRTQQLIEQLNPSSIPDSNELNRAKDFFMEHIRNDYKKEQYRETFNNLTEKINQDKNCSNEVTLLKLLDREAKENSLVKFVELREEQKKYYWLRTLTEVLEFREQFFSAFIKDPEKRELYHNIKETLIRKNYKDHDYFKESEILNQLDVEAYNQAATEFSSIISRPDEQPYDYSSLSEKSYFFNQHVKDQRMQDEYKYIQNVLVEKRRYREDCSLELEHLGKLDKIAKEVATPREEKKQEEIKAEPAQPPPPPKPKEPSWKDRYSPKEVQAIETEIKRLQSQLDDYFIPLGDDKIPKGYRTFVVAVKRGEKVIIDFCNESGSFAANLQPAVRKSSVQEIRNLAHVRFDLDPTKGYILKKEGGTIYDWMVYEVGAKKGQSLEGALKGEFKSAKLDENLRLRFLEVFNILSFLITNQISDLKERGIAVKKQIDFNQAINPPDNNQNRGMRR